MIAAEMPTAREHGLRRDERAPVQTAEGARQLPVLAERVREAAEARERRRRREQQDERAREPDVHAQRRVQPSPEDAGRARRRFPSAARRAQRVSQLGRAVADGKRHQADDRDPDVDGDDRADAAEEALRQLHAGAPRLLREVRDGLEPRVREHRERQREDELVPRRRAAERDADASARPATRAARGRARRAAAA